MALNLTGAVNQHKKIGKSYIHSSEVEVTIETKSTTVVVSSGAPLFSTLLSQEQYVSKGPFKCVWTDADSARTQSSGKTNSLLGRYLSASVVAKFWLQDLLVSGTDPYGETYLDRASHLVSSGKRYRILGYDRFGLGVTHPYMIAVALEGSYTSNG